MLFWLEHALREALRLRKLCAIFRKEYNTARRRESTLPVAERPVFETLPKKSDESVFGRD
jgi:hypothetical protein